MFIKSELKTREHCDSIRQQVDLAREIAIANIHKASNALMTEIDAYERECLSSWTATKESNEVIVEDVSKRTSAFLLEQQEYLQSVKSSDDELIVYMYEAKQLAQELSDRKKELKAAMFDNKLASFNAFPSIGDAFLGELAFTYIQLPFKKLDISSREITPVDIRVRFDGQRIVAFRLNAGITYRKSTTSFTCFDRLGRQIAIETVKGVIEPNKVAQSCPDQFVVCNYFDLPMLSVYDSDLHCLRTVRCKMFATFSCNSKFVFGMWNTNDSNETDSDDDDDDNHNDNNNDDNHNDNDNDDGEQEEEYSTEVIQVLNVDTLNKAFDLHVPKKYTIEQIFADEHRLVVKSQLNSERDPLNWHMIVFDLAICNESGGPKETRTFFLAEKTIDLKIDSIYEHIFLFDGWLVIPHKHELVWFDKNGTRSETKTEWDSENLRDIYSSGSTFILSKHDGKLLLKR